MNKKDSCTCDHALVVVKGLVEQQNAGAYFGSWIGLQSWITIAASRGLVILSSDGNPSVTDKGRKVYHAANLVALPHHGRGYAWDWKVTTPISESNRPPRSRQRKHKRREHKQSI